MSAHVEDESAVEAEVVPRLERIHGLDEIADEWDALAERSGSIFHTALWSRLWWGHFGRDRELLLHAARSADGGLPSSFRSTPGAAGAARPPLSRPRAGRRARPDLRPRRSGWGCQGTSHGAGRARLGRVPRRADARPGRLVDLLGRPHVAERGESDPAPARKLGRIRRRPKLELQAAAPPPRRGARTRR